MGKLLVSNNNYLPTVLIVSVGLTNNMARLLAACNSVSYLLFSLIGIPNVERWGRRKMMMYAVAGQFSATASLPSAFDTTRCHR
jgi:MFS family permease